MIDRIEAGYRCARDQAKNTTTLVVIIEPHVTCPGVSFSAKFSVNNKKHNDPNNCFKDTEKILFSITLNVKN